MSSRAKLEEEKLKKKILDEAGDSFSHYTLQFLKQNQRPYIVKAPTVIDFSLSKEVDILLITEEPIARDKRRDSLIIDKFLLSGRFNWVIGLAGLKLLKDWLLNESDMKPSQLSKFIFSCGIYYEYDEASKKLRELFDTFDHRSAHREFLKRNKNYELSDLDSFTFDQFKVLQKNSVTEDDYRNFQKVILRIIADVTSDLCVLNEQMKKIDINNLKNKAG